jgi:3-phosphoshikimate 1-carboxyvinyltransferase
VEAMRTELSKLGEKPLHFSAHNDHRIVMALAPLSFLFGPATFDYPEVVKKSYPNYWEDVSFLPVKR